MNRKLCAGVLSCLMMLVPELYLRGIVVGEVRPPQHGPHEAGYVDGDVEEVGLLGVKGPGTRSKGREVRKP